MERSPSFVKTFCAKVKGAEKSFPKAYLYGRVNLLDALFVSLFRTVITPGWGDGRYVDDAARELGMSLALVDYCVETGGNEQNAERLLSPDFSYADARRDIYNRYRAHHAKIKEQLRSKNNEWKQLVGDKKFLVEIRTHSASEKNLNCFYRCVEVLAKATFERVDSGTGAEFDERVFFCEALASLIPRGWCRVLIADDSNSPVMSFAAGRDAVVPVRAAPAADSHASFATVDLDEGDDGAIDIPAHVAYNYGGDRDYATLFTETRKAGESIENALRNSV